MVGCLACILCWPPGFSQPLQGEPAAASGPAQTPHLSPGTVLEVSGLAEEVQRFEVSTTSRWVDLRLDKGGGLASLRLLDSSGRQLLWPRGPNLRFGREWLVWQADEAAQGERGASEERTYRLEVHFATRGSHRLSFIATSSEGLDPGRGDALRRLGARRLSGEAADAFRQDDAASRRRSLALYARAEEAWRGLGDVPEQGQCLLSQGILHQRSGAPDEARKAVEGARLLFRSAAHHPGEAVALNLAGALARSQGELQRAGTLYDQALRLHRQLGDACGEARSRLNLGLLQQHGGEPRAARQQFEAALALCPAADDPVLGAEILVDMAAADASLGRPQAASAALRQAIPLLRRQGRRSHLAAALGNLGALERQSGNYQAAFEAFHSGLDVAREAGDRRRRATLLNSLGYAYLRLGEAPRALTFFLEALPLRRLNGDRRGEAVTLSNLGRTYVELGKLSLARQHYQQSLDLRRQVGDRRGEVTTLLRLAQSERLDGQAAAADGLLQQALELSTESGDRRAVAQATFRLADGRLQDAEEEHLDAAWRPVLQQVREIRDGIADLGDRELLAEGCALVAALQRRLGELLPAFEELHQAMDLLESVRSEVSDPDLRASYLARQRQTYGLAIDVALDLHRLDPTGAWHHRALAIDERFRARSLLDRMALAGRLGTQGSADTPQRQDLQRRLQRLEGQLTDPSQADRGALRVEIERTVSELERLEATPRSGSNQAAQSPGRVLSVGELQQQLGQKTLALQIFLGQEQSTLWAIDASTVEVLELPPRREIDAVARQLHAAWGTLEMRRHRHQDVLTGQLSDALLKPLAARLAGYQRLVFIVDGALHYLPLAALPDPRPEVSPQPLVAGFEVVQVPSLSTVAWLRQRRQGGPPGSEPWPQRIVVVADPIFSPQDPRLPMDVERSSEAPVIGLLSRLPGSAVEARAIARLAPDRSRLLLGTDASRQTVLAGTLGSADIVHFATHARIDDQLPRLSGLSLSYFDASGRAIQGHLALDDIYGLETTADLVVLSGCRTALGKAQAGEGLSGLMQGFLQAGASQVVATLWPVQDEASQVLMAHYYRALLTAGQSPAAALRTAQNAMRGQARWQDPYYWAAFVHLGEWRS